jgi:hypothetical protein
MSLKSAASRLLAAVLFATAAASASTMVVNGTFAASGLDPWQAMIAASFGQNPDYLKTLPALVDSYVASYIAVHKPGYLGPDPRTWQGPQVSRPPFELSAAGVNLSTETASGDDDQESAPSGSSLWTYQANWLEAAAYAAGAQADAAPAPALDVQPVAELDLGALTQGNVVSSMVPVTQWTFNTSSFGVQTLQANALSNPYLQVTFAADAVPEPSTILYVGAGTAAIAFWDARRRRGAEGLTAKS